MTCWWYVVRVVSVFGGIIPVVQDMVEFFYWVYFSWIHVHIFSKNWPKKMKKCVSHDTHSIVSFKVPCQEPIDRSSTSLRQRQFAYLREKEENCPQSLGVISLTFPLGVEQQCSTLGNYPQLLSTHTHLIMFVGSYTFFF